MKKKVLSLITLSILSVFTLISCSNMPDSTDASANVSTETPSDVDKDLIDDSFTDTSSNPTDESVDTSNDNLTNESVDTSSDNSDLNSSEDTTASVTLEDLQLKTEELFTETVNVLFNADYSTEAGKLIAKKFINDNFIKDAQDKMIEDINNYHSKMSTSDFLITLIEDVTPSDSQYSKVFKIRYNITVLIDKPTVYQDLYATAVVTDSNEVLMQSLYEYHF